tara:strand:+ start:443 stop:829 length:387 start_codon:yes stop_codon:yes gene_type:complete
MLYTIHDNNKKIISINESILASDNIIINNESLTDKDSLTSNEILSNNDSLKSNDILLNKHTLSSNENLLDIENNKQSTDIENNRTSSSISSLCDSYHLSEDENSEISLFSYFNVGKELLKNQNNEKNK